MEFLTATLPRISTITITASLHRAVDIDALFWALPLEVSEPPPPPQPGPKLSCGIVRVERAVPRTRELRIRVRHAVHGHQVVVNRRDRRSFTCFDNQLTVVYRQACSFVSIKVFRNGNMQMTGAKYVAQPLDALRVIAACAGASAVRLSDLTVHMINCDCRVNCAVDRVALFQLLKDTYGLPCSFEPCTYPGVKVYCENGDAKHSRTTISVFHSGCIIITGALTYAQMQQARQYILRLLRENHERVCAPTAEARVPPRRSRGRRSHADEGGR
jgi:TATA-box binding protein (TBP) (component of TFIID and TFIIIB)